MTLPWTRLSETMWSREYYDIIKEGPRDYVAYFMSGQEFGHWETAEEAMFRVDQFIAKNEAELKAAGVPGSEQFNQPLKDFYGR